jgi:hypothetical protein
VWEEGKRVKEKELIKGTKEAKKKVRMILCFVFYGF